MKRKIIIGIVFFFVLVLIVVLFFLFKNFFGQQKPGSCLILSETNCKKVKIIEIDGRKIATANLPKGTILFSPVSGQYSNTLNFRMKNDVSDFGARIDSIDLVDPNNKAYTFVYSKISDRQNETDDGNIKKGEQIGIIDNIKLKNFSDYNLVFYISQKSQDNKTFIPAEDILLKIFTND